MLDFDSQPQTYPVHLDPKFCDNPSTCTIDITETCTIDITETASQADGRTEDRTAQHLLEVFSKH